MSATHTQLLLDPLLSTNFTEDPKTPKLTKSSMSLLKSANREIKKYKGEGKEMSCFYPVFQQKSPSGPEPTKENRQRK